MGEAAALGAAFLYSLNTVFMRWGGLRVDLLWLNAFRCGTAALVMLAVSLAVKGPETLIDLPLSAMLWLALTTLVMIAIGDSLFYLSCQHIGVARSSPIANSYPLVSVVLAVAFLDEPATWRLGAGTLLVLLGAYLVAKPGSSTALISPVTGDTSRKVGLLLALAAFFSWGLGAIFDRLAMQVPAVDLVGAATFRLLAATFFLFLLALRRPCKIHWAGLPARFAISFLAVAVVCGVGAPFLWLFAVQQIGAARASLLSASGPLWGVVLATLLLREPVARSIFVGAVFTVVGVWVIL